MSAAPKAPWAGAGGGAWAYLKGISTRKADDLARAMGMTGSYGNEVSRMFVELDDWGQKFPSRPLGGE